MTQIPALPFARSDDDRVIAGVCGGVASTLNVDATLVRLVFALLSLAGGRRHPPLPGPLGLLRHEAPGCRRRRWS